ncbi:hypothetical protein S83_069689 [Arachis hypogaea]|nr:uncharacterized protein LOC112784933 [Arachis hypogaea]QHN81568.1 uncharacterized protein DS421_20g688000 [Arachis hypogaea]
MLTFSFLSQCRHLLLAAHSVYVACTNVASPTAPPPLFCDDEFAQTTSLHHNMTLIQLHLCSAKNLHCFCSTMRNLLCSWPPPPLQEEAFRSSMVVDNNDGHVGGVLANEKLSGIGISVLCY